MPKCVSHWKHKTRKYGIFWLTSSLAGLFFCTAANAEALTASTFEALGAADVVIVGELHDNPIHHANQAAIARVIYPSALVFEMLTAEQAEAGQAADRSVLADLDAALEWSSRGGWPSFRMYFPIFAAAPQARIYGAAVPRDKVRAAVQDGAASQVEDAAVYGLDVTLTSEEQFARETMQATAHCNALPADMLSGMVEAQRLRDASFAEVILQALKDTGGAVLVITGNGHARTDWGVPTYLRRVASDVDVISVGQVVEGEISPPYDRWILTGSFDAGTGDRCDAFSSN